MTPKLLVTIIASTLVLCSAVVIASYTAQFGTVKLIPHIVRFSLTCALAISLVKGWTPGRWIAVVLMALAGLGSMLGGMKLAVSGSGLNGVLVLGVIYVACLAALVTPYAGLHFSKKR